MLAAVRLRAGGVRAVPAVPLPARPQRPEGGVEREAEPGLHLADLPAARGLPRHGPPAGRGAGQHQSL